MIKDAEVEHQNQYGRCTDEGPFLMVPVQAESGIQNSQSADRPKQFF